MSADGDENFKQEISNLFKEMHNFIALDVDVLQMAQVCELISFLLWLTKPNAAFLKCENYRYLSNSGNVTVFTKSWNVQDFLHHQLSIVLCLYHFKPFLLKMIVIIFHFASSVPSCCTCSSVLKSWSTCYLKQMSVTSFVTWSESQKMDVEHASRQRSNF